MSCSKVEQAEQQQAIEQVPPPQVVTKQKDPRRVAMGRQLGLRSQEFKLKKREMMESGKQQEQQLQQPSEQVETDSGSRTQMIAMSGLTAALAFGYLIYTNISTKYCCPPSSPPDGGERAEQVKVSQPVDTPNKPLLPLIETTGVGNME